MYTTHFDEVKKVWSGPELNVQTGEYRNFGEYLLEKLADSDCERVMQVNIMSFKIIRIHLIVLTHSISARTFYTYR